MKEYQFQYSKMWDTFLIFSFCMLLSLFIILIGVYLFVPIIIILSLVLVLVFIMFRGLKGKALHLGSAKLSETSVLFEFNDNTRTIEFKDLISFKVYYGKNGPVLYLKNNTDNFKLFANSNFCDTDAFSSFCKDILIQLEKYKSVNKPDLIHEGSIFSKKGMLHFLIIATSIYILSFFIKNSNWRLMTCLVGGSFLFAFWLGYFSEKNNELRLKKRT